MASALLALAMRLGPPVVAAQPSGPQVVILNSYHQGEEWSDAEIAGVATALQERYPDIAPSIEHLDAKRFPEPGQLALAGDALAAPILVGLGVSELSMNPAAIPRVKAVLRSVNLAEAQALADRALSTKSTAEARALAQAFAAS
jgi:hypothetical protein